MENQRLIHDVTLMMAQHCIEMLSSLLREEELVTAKEEFCQVCKAGIETYITMADRLRHRLNPTIN